jgi:hypothetical protein
MVVAPEETPEMLLTAVADDRVAAPVLGDLEDLGEFMWS